MGMPSREPSYPRLSLPKSPRLSLRSPPIYAQFRNVRPAVNPWTAILPLSRRFAAFVEECRAIRGPTRDSAGIRRSGTSCSIQYSSH